MLNELGAFLWELLPEARDEKDLLRAVLAEYEVDEATAAADITEFLEQLKAMKII